MPKSVRVHVDETSQSSDHVRRIARAEYFDGSVQVAAREFFFELSAPEAARPLPTSDWAVLAVLFRAMRWGRDIHINGAVSKTLLDNLDEFQSAFTMWMPELSIVEISAKVEVSPTASPASDDAVVAFSGGVDASFTAYRHIFKSPGRRHKNLRTAMLVHGFDIPIENEGAFAEAVRGAERILSGTSVSIAVVRTNLKSMLGVDWEQSFGAALAACLHQFSAGHGVGLIGSDEAYKHLVFPWGSNPVTNHLLGSDFMKVITDGSGFTRTQKLASISRWQQAVDNIRVCWEGPITGRNCGKCEKCVRTILNFRAMGLPLTQAFPYDVSDEQIKRLNVDNPVKLAYLADIHDAAQANQMSGSWISELEAAIDRGALGRRGGKRRRG